MIPTLIIPQFFILFFMVVVALAIVAFIVGQKRAEARRKELSAFAARMGWSFDPARGYHYDDRFPGFDFLRKGSRRYAYNILQVSWAGHRALVFDYHWQITTNNGKSSTTRHYHATFVLVQPGWPMRPFVMRPEGILDSLAEFFGSQDIDFESAAFSENFHVNSPDRKWTYDFFNARAIQYVMDCNMKQIACDGEMLAADWERKLLSPAEIEMHLKRINGLLELMPDYMKKGTTA